jgi:hypothetical protein
MARIRYLKPEFFEDTRLADLSRDIRLFYAGLWCQLDRLGITENEPKILKKQIFPYDDDITASRVAEMIEELIRIGRLIRIEDRDKSYLYCPSFTRHQNFHVGEKPKHGHLVPKLAELSLAGKKPDPAPNATAPVQHGASTVQAPFDDRASTTGIGIGTETEIETGIETGTGARCLPSPSPSPSPSSSPGLLSSPGPNPADLGPPEEWPDAGPPPPAEHNRVIRGPWPDPVALPTAASSPPEPKPPRDSRPPDPPLPEQVARLRSPFAVPDDGVEPGFEFHAVCRSIWGARYHPPGEPETQDEPEEATA